MPDSDQLGAVLLKLARDAIGRQFGLPSSPPERLPELHEPGAVFVTLKCDGALRGCIGSLEAYRPLLEDVCEHAVDAAFRDPRFPPLSRAEFDRLDIEVSLLSPPQPLAFASEAEALDKLRPGLDGVIFSAMGRRSTFLPQVWEDLPEPEVFLAHLKRKAGLPADYWSADVRLEVYQVRKWKEAPR